MKFEARVKTTEIVITLPADEAQELYAELYRVTQDSYKYNSIDHLPVGDYIVEIMRQLAAHGLDE